MLIILSNYVSLEELYINEWLEEEAFEQKLSIIPSSGLVASLLSSVTGNLVDLRLAAVVHADQQIVCPALSHLPGIVHLELEFSDDTVFSAVDLDHLSKLSKLESLRLGCMDAAAGWCDWLTDQQFEQLIAKLPRLRHLVFPPVGKVLTFVAVESLARSCPLLEKCELLWEHDLSTWHASEAPLFPNLETLHLGQAKDHEDNDVWGFGHDEASTYAQLLLDLAPRLKNFCLGAVNRSRVSICQDETCLLAPMATCAAYPATMKPAKSNSTMAGSTASSNSTMGGSAAPTSSKPASYSGAAAKVGAGAAGLLAAAVLAL
ncbi:hypothetical protein JADG_002097 [Aureobasidium aubasidani]|nr:hypothetical protein JADG_002097 [Aureobasidium pullulans]